VVTNSNFGQSAVAVIINSVGEFFRVSFFRVSMVDPFDGSKIRRQSAEQAFDVFRLRKMIVVVIDSCECQSFVVMRMQRKWLRENRDSTSTY
jgi:hypothetical protein